MGVLKMTFNDFMNQQPTEITLFITGKCNFNCEFCGFKDTTLFPDITTKTLDGVVSQLKKILHNDDSKKFYINIMGGEPTIDMELLATTMQKLSPLRTMFPDNIMIEITTNGQFAMSAEQTKQLYEMNFDHLVISCSKDHFDQGNAEYIKALLQSEYKFNVTYNIVLGHDDIRELYETAIGKTFDDFANGQVYESSDCLNLTNKTDIENFYKSCSARFTVRYAPFGLFIVDNAIYTACSGEGTFPWCKLSDTTDNIAECLEMIAGKEMVVEQPCCKEFVPTCRYLQSQGYTCFNCPHKLRIESDGTITQL